MNTRVVDGDPRVLRWFTGKAQERAKEALALLEASMDADEWQPGVSRKVRAALNKCSVAHRFARDQKPVLDSIEHPNRRIRERDRTARGFDLFMAMAHGSLGYLLRIDMPALWKLAKTDEQKEALARGQEFYDDFRTIAEAMRVLDETRPKPVFTTLGVSRTITKTLQDADLDLDPTTVRWPPIEWVMVEKVDAKGNRLRYREPRIKWPKGTVFHAGRFSAWGDRNTGTSHHQCEACGHGIRNPANWFPVLIDNKKGRPHAIWVGRDCAWNVFGIKVTGHLEFKPEDRK